jgi:ribonuclease HIII
MILAMGQKTRVLVVAPAERQRLARELAETSLEQRSVPHALVSVKGEGVVATLYASGKLVVQGEDPDLFCERYLGARAGPARSAPSEVLEPAVGSDEVGKGDYFGPLVVAAVRLSPEQSRELAGSRVGESKAISDESALRLGAALRARYPHAIAELLPEDYNRRYVAGRLNELLADLHARAIGELARAGDLVVVDQFAREDLLERRLASHGLRLVQRPRAEELPIVAAASVIARERFLLALAALSEEAGLDLHKGAGAPVDRAGAELARLHGLEGLARFAKLHFKNTERIRARLARGPRRGP